MKRSKGFTLIELLAVIVILAIIALIAVPLVLKYINTAKEGANDASVKSILRAAENYYADSLLNSDVQYPKTINFPDSNNELGLKGRQPDSGYVEIYEDGTMSIFVTYDEKDYIILPGDDTVISDEFIATSNEWLSDGNGLAYHYTNMSAISMLIYDVVEVLEEIENCSSLSAVDEVKTCVDAVDATHLPSDYEKEVKIYKEMFYAVLETNVTPSDSEIQSKIPKLYALISGGEDNFDEELFKSKVNKFYIPSVIVHEDGTLEKITSVGYAQIEQEDGTKIMYFPFVSTNDTNAKSVTTLVVPDTLEIIGASSFASQYIKNIDFSNAKSLKTVGASAFANNPVLTKVTIPASVETIGNQAFKSIPTLKELVFEGATDGTSKLKTIGISAFCQNYSTPCGGSMTGTSQPCTSEGFLEGTLYIPASVTKIDDMAFTGMNKLTVKFVGADDGTSKLNEIGQFAFYNIGNPDNVTLPGSVTKIEQYAFGGNKSSMYSQMILKKTSTTGMTLGTSWYRGKLVLDS